MTIRNSNIVYILYSIAFIYDITTEKENIMDNGYAVKIQKVERPTNRSYYINFPVALAEALDMRKGEEFPWIIEDKNTLILKRKKLRKPRKQAKIKD